MASRSAPRVFAQGKKEIVLLPPMANRHGLVAGAAGSVLEWKDDVIVVEKGKEKWEIARDKDTKVSGRSEGGSQGRHSLSDEGHCCRG